MGTLSQNPDVCSYRMCYKHFPNTLQGALSIWTSGQVNFPENIVVAELLHHRIPLTLLSCALFPLFSFWSGNHINFQSRYVQSAMMKMKVTVKDPARRDFSTLLSAYVIKTSKLSFHGMFPFFSGNTTDTQCNIWGPSLQLLEAQNFYSLHHKRYKCQVKP